MKTEKILFIGLLGAILSCLPAQAAKSQSQPKSLYSLMIKQRDALVACTKRSSTRAESAKNCKAYANALKATLGNILAAQRKADMKKNNLNNMELQVGAENKDQRAASAMAKKAGKDNAAVRKLQADERNADPQLRAADRKTFDAAVGRQIAADKNAAEAAQAKVRKDNLAAGAARGSALAQAAAINKQAAAFKANLEAAKNRLDKQNALIKSLKDSQKRMPYAHIASLIKKNENVAAKYKKDISRWSGLLAQVTPHVGPVRILAGKGYALSVQTGADAKTVKSEKSLLNAAARPSVGAGHANAASAARANTAKANAANTARVAVARPQAQSAAQTQTTNVPAAAQATGAPAPVAAVLTSTQSAGASGTPAPTDSTVLPTVATATATGNSITVNWTVPPYGVAIAGGFQVMAVALDGSGVITGWIGLQSYIRTWTFTGLASGTKYAITVATLVGNRYFPGEDTLSFAPVNAVVNTQIATTTGAKTTMSGMTVTSIAPQATSVAVSWTAASNSTSNLVRYYQIAAQPGAAGATATQWYNLGPTVSSYTLTGLTSGQPYILHYNTVYTDGFLRTQQTAQFTTLFGP